MSKKRFGARRERQVRDSLVAAGWLVVRATGSLGFADLVALKAGERPLMVEVKANAGSPFKNFPPERRRELVEAAEMAGAVAVLAHWPPRGKLQWIYSSEWP